ncbi:hypothetical protein EDC94DRAFT_626141 [Helicostylum pulchrum]|nr:hypothetical protein EDC94DRAFT_626141 [Helicostylum pulchrum]
MEYPFIIKAKQADRSCRSMARLQVIPSQKMSKLTDCFVVDTLPTLVSPNPRGHSNSCCTSVEIMASGHMSVRSWCADLFAHRKATCRSRSAIISDKKRGKLSDLETLTSRVIEGSKDVPIENSQNFIQHSIDVFPKCLNKEPL